MYKKKHHKMIGLNPIMFALTISLATKLMLHLTDPNIVARLRAHHHLSLIMAPANSLCIDNSVISVHYSNAKRDALGFQNSEYTTYPGSAYR